MKVASCGSLVAAVGVLACGAEPGPPYLGSTGHGSTSGDRALSENGAELSKMLNF